MNIAAGGKWECDVRWVQSGGCGHVDAVMTTLLT